MDRAVVTLEVALGASVLLEVTLVKVVLITQTSGKFKNHSKIQGKHGFIPNAILVNVIL